jgi:hypothetical protein
MVDHIQFYSACLSFSQITAIFNSNPLVVEPQTIDLQGTGLRRIGKPVTGDDAVNKSYVDGREQVVALSAYNGWGTPYISSVDDMNGTIFTDVGCTEVCIIRLPKLSHANIHGGIFKVLASREAANEGDYNNMIAVYPNYNDSIIYPERAFIQGASDGSYNSLYSSDVGNYIELVPFFDGNGFTWRVINIMGWWEDRD